MKIELITGTQYKVLRTYYKSFPELTLQNKGYEGIRKEDLSEADKEAIINIEKILQKHICGFTKFQNFRLSKSGDIQIRFQYNYNYNNDRGRFYGVGYITLLELLEGFKESN